MDDLSGLIVGPLFLVAEAAFHFNMRLEVKAAIDVRLGTQPQPRGNKTVAAA